MLEGVPVAICILSEASNYAGGDDLDEVFKLYQKCVKKIGITSVPSKRNAAVDPVEEPLFWHFWVGSCADAGYPRA